MEQWSWSRRGGPRHWVTLEVLGNGRFSSRCVCGWVSERFVHIPPARGAGRLHMELMEEGG